MQVCQLLCSDFVWKSRADSYLALTLIFFVLSLFLFTVQPAVLLDWVLVLYGTDRHPQQVPTTTSTSTTAAPTSSTTTAPPSNYPRSVADKANPRVPVINNFPERYNNIFRTNLKSPYARRKPPLHRHHMCIFETLAKRNNISSMQYRRAVGNSTSDDDKS